MTLAVFVLLTMILGASTGVAQAASTTDAETQLDATAAVNVALLTTETGPELSGNTAGESTQTAATSDSTTAEQTQPAANNEADAGTPSEPAANPPAANTETDIGMAEAVNAASEETITTTAEIDLTGANTLLGADHNGDGRTEIVVLYDLGNATTGLYVYEPTDTGFAAPQRVWTSAAGAWSWLQSKLMVTDHNGDGRTEVTVLYDLGNATTGLYVFEPTDTGYAAPQRVWASATGAWDWSKSQPTVTDRNGDGRSEVTVLYDLGNATTGLYVFEPTDAGFAAPGRVWMSSPGAWSWRQSQPVVTDHNGDGRTEVTVLYDLGNTTTGLYVFPPTGGGFAAPGRVWMSSPGGWNLGQSRPLATDHDGDGRSEVTVLYHLGNSTLGIYMFMPTDAGFAAPGRVWMSGPGGWNFLQSKLMVTDHNGDGRTEISALYDLGNTTTGLYVFPPTGGGYTAPARTWTSGFRAWQWLQSKTVGYHFTPRVSYSGIMYLDINLSRQTLSAMGVKVVELALGYFFYTPQVLFSTLTSTGGPGMETPTGWFPVYAKHFAIDMSGPGYYAPDVPYVLWFYGPYSIHGTYWHNEFGWPHSHGCVNLPTPAAKWLFYRVPVGMMVTVHY